MKTVSTAGLRITRRVVVLWAVLFVLMVVVWVLLWGQIRIALSLITIVQVVPAVVSQIMRVKIRQDEEGDLELALWPFYRTRVPASTVISIEPPDAWTPTMRYGYAVFDGGTRGLLTGGPAITITTSGAHRDWLVSVEDPEAVIAALDLPRGTSPGGSSPDDVVDPA